MLELNVWFVYCYLRTGSNLPYYIGLGSRSDRVTGRHSCKVPKDRSRIRIMRQGLTKEAAIYWERFYIARYGRRDLGTGALVNRTHGGDATDHSPATRKKLSEAGRRPENVARLRIVNIGRKRPQHAIEAAAAATRVRWEQYRAERGRHPLPRDQVPPYLTVVMRKANEHGLCPVVWVALTDIERRRLHEWCRRNPGKTGSDYLQGERRAYGPAPKFSKELIAALRREGLTQAQVAKRLGCSQSRVSRLLSVCPRT